MSKDQARDCLCERLQQKSECAGSSQVESRYYIGARWPSPKIERTVTAGHRCPSSVLSGCLDCTGRSHVRSDEAEVAG